MDSWFYRNTCKEIVKDKWISFYVIRLDWDDYIYEKHYIDYIHWFYWILEIEKWQNVTKNNIAEKNTELKGNNDTFDKTDITDKIFKEIVNQ
jgi:hypothetical protein